MKSKIIALSALILIFVSLFSGCIQDEDDFNKIPTVKISYPYDKNQVQGIVMISGDAGDEDGDNTLERVEIKINDLNWDDAEGTTQWSYNWNTYDMDDGIYAIKARSWDGFEYSEIDEILVRLDNPESVETDSHKWAIFVAVANSGANNSKLGNGGLYLSEDMSSYLIEEKGYSTDNIFLLFDDGWIRTNNGYGRRIATLQQRRHDYDINYGAATKNNVESTIKHIISESNKYEDSEVFIWFFAHGCGDENDSRFGGKILERSEIKLWDSFLADNELGHLLSTLKSKETTIIIDACFSGGFADKTIFNFPEVFLLKSELARTGRVVITGASKYRVGYASTTSGPLFTLLWFDGIISGDADGYRPGLFKMGRPTKLKMFEDGKVSVEEAFYYARYMFKNTEELDMFDTMEPQINDKYPKMILNGEGLILG